jgi:hypothetical protein
MTPQHFKEVLEIVCMTTGRSKAEISRKIGVTPTTLWLWENKSFSGHKQPYVIHQLKEILAKGKVHMNFVSDNDIKKAEANGVNYKNLYNRVYRLGWEVERAIHTPVKKDSRIAKYRPLLQKHGIAESVFYTRIYQQGWDLEEAATTPLLTPGEVLKRKQEKRGYLTQEQIKTAESNGISLNTLRARVYRQKWPVGKAISEPVRYNHGKAFMNV